MTGKTKVPNVGAPQPDVEMEALRAVAKALASVDKEAQTRILQWAISFYGVYLPSL